MSSGNDGIPLRLVKFYSKAFPLHYANVFNDVLLNGIPEAWKVARLVAVPKKGDLLVVSN